MTQDDAFLQQEQQLAEELLETRWITPENARFTRTDGGFLSMEYRDKQYQRVAVHRCFPFSAPDTFLSIREPEGEGREIGLIRALDEFPQAVRDLLVEQMNLRYFTPRIRHIHSIKEEYGYSYWEVTTDKGRCRFTVRMGNGSVYPVGEGRYIVNDLDGNRFEIPDIHSLSAVELKRLDLFI